MGRFLLLVLPVAWGFQFGQHTTPVSCGRPWLRRAPSCRCEVVPAIRGASRPPPGQGFNAPGQQGQFSQQSQFGQQQGGFQSTSPGGGQGGFQQGGMGTQSAAKPLWSTYSLSGTNRPL